jgi:hypothetical protein
MDIHDQKMKDHGLYVPEPKTHEQGLYDYWVNTKPHPKIYNCQYWLKHELYVYKTFHEKGWIISKPWKHGEARVQVTFKELARELLRYYFQMVTLSSFEGERRAERGMLVDLDKFLDLVIEHPTIKKLIENPDTLI